MNKKVKPIYYILSFIFVVLIDRITKIWALKNLYEHNIEVFPGFDLSLAWNRGISLGLFGSASCLGSYVLTAFIFIVVCIFAFYVFNLFKTGHSIYFEVLILAGAISNLIDRFLYSAVIDFIDFYVLAWHWPTFNLADTAIVVGVFGIIGRLLKNVYPRKN